MLQIQFSHDYLTAQELMLLEKSFTEEVIAEIKDNEYLLTCSLGRNQNQAYITWNLFQYDQLAVMKSTKINNNQLNIFDKNALQKEMIYKFRQMLLKTVNRSGDVGYASKVWQLTPEIQIQNYK